MYVPTAVLGALLLLATGALLAHSSIEDRRYRQALEAETAKIEPQARRAQTLDAEIQHTLNRARLLDEFRRRTKADLDSLDELTRLLAPPTWTNTIDLTPGAATINGETEQAAPLLKLLDASPHFRNSTFIGSIAKSGGSEQFQIRTAREAGR